MPIVLPQGHPGSLPGPPREPSAGAKSPTRPVRVGVINIMPKLEAYEPLLLGPLGRVGQAVEPVFIRLTSHGYLSSDGGHLGKFYASFEAALATGPLDALIVTGAPVEELEFEDVHYWKELTRILDYARGDIACTLGLCWGGLAIGKVLGVEKRAFKRKLFGVFEDRVLVPDHDLLASSDDDDRAGRVFVCAHSRHAGVSDDDLERAERDGEVRILSRGEQSGYSMFETPDGRFVAHVGHPEYGGERLAFEWARDRSLGRPDVYPPEHFDADAPTTPWRGHREALFKGFIERALRR